MKPRKIAVVAPEAPAATDNLDHVLPPIRCSLTTLKRLEMDMLEEGNRTGLKRKLSTHIRWILENHLANQHKSAK